MGTLADILNAHREELKDHAERQRIILILCILATFVSGFIALYTFWTGRFPIPVFQDFMSENKDWTLSIANFFVATALTAMFKIWRMRETRIKTLIAEAFLEENDEDTALRLILELQLGDTAWLNEQLKLLAARQDTEVTPS